MSVAIKERPILFRGEMVRAIKSDRKSQTRRIVKLNDSWDVGPNYAGECWPVRKRGNVLERMRCPYGEKGDRLWVRETFVVCANNNIFFKADGKPDPWDGVKWKPSIFMPRLASRILLEVTSVRAERLNDISRQDAVAEGIRRVGYSERAIDTPGGEEMVDLRCWMNYTNPDTPFGSMSQIHSFASLWESNHGGGSWALNPWVWVVEFKRVDGE